MPRARLLKPGFFKDEVLATLPFGARLGFQGLWVLADRLGRLEDRAAWIKVETFPYDVDITADTMEAFLGALSEKGFILRYRCKDKRYIQIRNFLKHQSPHVREPSSTIPAPGKPRTHRRRAPEMPEADTSLAHRSLDPETESVPVYGVGDGDGFKNAPPTTSTSTLEKEAPTSQRESRGGRVKNA